MIRRLTARLFYLAARPFELVAMGLYALGGWIGGDAVADDPYADDFDGELRQ